MIILTKTSEIEINARIHMNHSEDIFAQARSFYHQYESMRREYIQVHDGEGGKILYYLHWEANKDKQHSSITHVSSFWDVDIDNERLDFELIDRSQVFIFEKFEEYTYELTRIIRKHRPDRFIFFLDDKARFFFKESDCVHILDNIDHLYLDFPYFMSKSKMIINSDREIEMNADHTFDREYSSLHLMSSLFWKNNSVRFGDMHPDKTFYLVKNTISNESLIYIVKYCLFRVAMADNKRGHLIPIIDQESNGNENKFSNQDGENIWSLYFEQLVDIPLEEVYQSRNVILAQDRQLYFNPYIEEYEQFADWCDLFRKYLKFNKKTEDYIKKFQTEILPAEKCRKLGVIGYGKDDKEAEVGENSESDTDASEFFEGVRSLLQDNQFDRVFLASEDDVIIRKFKTSDIQDKIIYVTKDDFNEPLKFISILTILSECEALVSNIKCDTFRFAVGMNNHKYEFTKIL